MASQTNYYGIITAIAEIENIKYLNKAIVESHRKRMESFIPSVSLSIEKLEESRKRYNEVPLSKIVAY